MRMLEKDTYGALREHGFAKFSCPDFTDGNALLDEVTQRLGCDVISGWHTLSPTEKTNASPVSYSGLYGLGQFPMHTDLANWKLPPRFMILWAEVGAENVSTPVLDCSKVIGSSEAKELSRALVKPRRPVQGRLPIMRLHENIGRTHGFFRWDPIFLKAASPAGGKGIELMSSVVGREKTKNVCLGYAGDGVIIDNWRMLHGRSEIEHTDNKRRLRRAYLRTI